MRKYKVGNKVILREDLFHRESYGRLLWHESKEVLRDSPYIEIDSLGAFGDYNVKDSIGRSYLISDEMIAGLYEEDETKYLWASDEYEVGGFKYIKFLIKGNNTRSHDVDSRLHKEILKGKHDKFLMTESEAKEHHLFKAMNRMEVEKEELYYIRIKGNETECINYCCDHGIYSIDNVDEEAGFKTKFTKEECDEIIGTSTILHKVLVK